MSFGILILWLMMQAQGTGTVTTDITPNTKFSTWVTTSNCVSVIDGHCAISMGCGTGDFHPVGHDGPSRQACYYTWKDEAGKQRDVTTCSDYTGKPKPCQESSQGAAVNDPKLVRLR